jgi:hypothetical protein
MDHDAAELTPVGGSVRPQSLPAEVDLATRLRALPGEWYEAWNAHDLERILAHYADDVEFSSPFIAVHGISQSGRISGKPGLRAYWSRAFEAYPDLHFDPIAELYGVESVTLHYRGVGGILAAEVHELGSDGRIVRACAHYERLPDRP